MLRKILWLMLPVLFIPALAVAAIHTNPKTPLKILPVLSGSEPGPLGPLTPQFPPLPVISETDLVGDTVTLGITWYENQHNGTVGRMNTLEPNGWRQFAWMKGYQSGAGDRHIWWNSIDPNGVQVFPGNGVAVESSYRGGFTTFDVLSNGSGLPAYHNVVGAPNNLPQVAVSMDLIPHAGAFLDFQAPPAPVAQVIWPHMQLDQSGRLHIVAMNQTAAAGNPQRQYYIGATVNTPNMTITYDPSWQFIDWTQTIAIDVNTSPVAGSNKTVWAWTRSREYIEPNPDSTYNQRNNDIYYLIDDDGLNPNFSQKFNLTNFIPPDPALLPDTLLADRDTLRAYTDLNCFIDHNNFAHISFTTASFFEIEGATYWNASIIWHWSEQYPDTFTVIANYWAENNNVDCGVWNLKAQRPSLGEDAQGTLYCMYQVYDTDTLHLTAPPNQWPSGEIYLSKSTDGGRHWSQGLNVTSTNTPTNALPGQSLSELTPTLAERVNNYCHILYVLDRDAGNILQTEGSWTENQVRYHRVPVSAIPSTPLVPNIRFHVGPVTGVEPDHHPTAAPYAFNLKPVYPNPFNSTAAITFTLDAPRNISLAVYNSQGQFIANVAEGTYGPGEHAVSFDASDLPSGVYFCKLIAGERSAQQKMVLLK